MAPYSFDLPVARASGISETQMQHVTTAPNTSTAPVVSSPQSISYASIASGSFTGGLSWLKFLAPTTKDPVYVAHLANGSIAYVGPDNSPAVGPASDFYQTSLHGANYVADPNGAYFSPYGPKRLAGDRVSWSSILGLIPGVQQAHYGTAAASPVDVPKPPAFSLPQVLTPPAIAAAAAAAIAPITSPAATTVVGNSTAAVPQSLTDALTSALAGGGGGFTSTDSGVGVPSTAGVVAGDVPALDALQPASVASSSTSNPSLLIAIAGAGIVAAIVLYERNAHKGKPKKKPPHAA